MNINYKKAFRDLINVSLDGLKDFSMQEIIILSYEKNIKELIYFADRYGYTPRYLKKPMYKLGLFSVKKIEEYEIEWIKGE